jgi:transposase
VYCCTDNSLIHIKNVIRELVEARVHQLLFLPQNSHNLNDIEHNFSAFIEKLFYSFTKEVKEAFAKLIPGFEPRDLEDLGVWDKNKFIALQKK